MSEFGLDPQTTYILDPKTALQYPQLLKPDPSQEANQRLFIASHQAMVEACAMASEQSDEGFRSNRLVNYLTQIINNGTKEQHQKTVEYSLYDIKIKFDLETHSGKKRTGGKFQSLIDLAEYWVNNSYGRNIAVLTSDKSFSVSAVGHRIATTYYSPAPYRGWRRFDNPEAANQLRKDGSISLADWERYYPKEESLNPNEFLIFGDSIKDIGYYKAERSIIIPLRYTNRLLGVTPNNQFQAMAAEAFFDEDADAICFMGPAGAGKTFLTTVASQQGSNSAVGVLITPKTKPSNRRKKQPIAIDLPNTATHPMGDEAAYKGSVIFIPDHFATGEDTATLPGNKLNKYVDALMPYTESVANYLQILRSKGYLCLSDEEIKAQAYQIRNKLSIGALGGIAGWSPQDSFLACVEAQNFSLLQLTTCLSRAGKGCKIVFNGDPYQTANPSEYYRTPLVEFANALKGDSRSVVICIPPENAKDATMRPGARIAANCLQSLW